MSRIRGRDTRPEILLRKALWKAGYRYRLNSDLPGRPDLVFPRVRLAVFMDGCFWHGCPLHYSAPSTRREFWAAKLRGNVEHDLSVDETLRDMGWQALHVWQHDLRDIGALVDRFDERLSSNFTDDREPLIAAEWLAEPRAIYDTVPNSPWYRCPCGSEEVRVLAVSEPGSLRPRAKKRPRRVELVCTRCRGLFDREPQAI